MLEPLLKTHTVIGSLFNKRHCVVWYNFKSSFPCMWELPEWYKHSAKSLISSLDYPDSSATGDAMWDQRYEASPVTLI